VTSLADRLTFPGVLLAVFLTQLILAAMKSLTALATVVTLSSLRAVTFAGSKGVTNVIDYHGRFLWYELMTTEPELAKTFYSKVIGWSTREASAPGMPYTMFTVGDASIGGLTDLPEDVRSLGAEPRWLGYIGVNDVDAAVCLTKKLGGTVHAPPADIPDVGRISVIADPQMATFAVVKSFNPAQHQFLVDGPGHVGWHELFANDAEKALAFYCELFGWQKGEAVTDSMGTYQQFSAGGLAIGGMCTNPPMVSLPFWLYYFNVSGIKAAAQRVTDGGGKILEGPVDVPGGSTVARCADPQGAMFSLIEKRKHKAIGYFERVASCNPAGPRPQRWSW
jgi:uncharacterized protein